MKRIRLFGAESFSSPQVRGTWGTRKQLRLRSVWQLAAQPQGKRMHRLWTHVQMIDIILLRG